MKGILREKWNSESGSAQIIEMTLIFPIVLFVLGFLIYVGSYVLQSTAMYTEAQKIAVIAAREGQMPGYENFFAGTGITTKTDFDWAIQTAAKKKQLDCSSAEFLTIEEGLCVQIMHVGSYDDEPASVAVMDEYLAQNGYANDLTAERLHHEIYLSDPRKTAPEKRKTVLRHPIKKA